MCINPIEINDPRNKGEKIKVPCRKCILCRRKQCRTWAIRLYHESQYHAKMCMITLTFRPKFLMRPKIKTLTKYHRIKEKDGNKLIEGYHHRVWKEKYQTMISPVYITDVRKTGWLLTLFMKKLRKYLQKQDIYISYFAVGEHGTQNTHRAHWHVLIFGIDKDTLQSVSVGQSKKNKEIYFSKIVHDLWSYENYHIGQHTISDVTSATIKYVANYTMKKMYKNVSKNKQYPTIMRFSNQNKIGTKWARRFHKELRKGYLLDNENQKYSIPKQYYEEMLKYESNLENASMNDTAEIIEQNKNDMIQKMLKNGLFSEENIKNKAKKLEARYKNQERDII